MLDARIVVSTSLVCLLACSRPTAAQTGSSASTAQADQKAYAALAERLTTESQVLPGLRDASAASAQGSGEPQFLLLASTDGGVTGRARVGYLLPGNLLIDGVISGPISGDSAQLVSAQGLGGKVTVETHVSAVVWKNRTEGLVTGNLAAESKMSPADPKAEAARPFASLVETTLAKARGQANTARKAALPNATEAVPTDQDVKGAFARAWRSDVLAKGQVRTLQSLLVTGGATVANNTFQYVTTTSLDAQHESHINRGVDVAVGFLQAKGDDFLGKNVEPLLYVGANAEFGRSYTGRSQQNLCGPSGIPGATRCQTIAVGAPTAADEQLLQGDFRWWLSPASLAITFRPSYEFKSSTSSFEFPIYFLKNAKDVLDPTRGGNPGLAGGVNIGWRQFGNNREFFAVMFVGTILSLPGLPQ